MRRKRGGMGLRHALLAVGLVAATTGGARATTISTGLSPLLTYDTIGSAVGTAGVTGTPAISFVPVTGGSFLAPSNLSLGKFMVAAQADGQSTNYVNTPFTLKFTADALNGNAVNPNETPVTLTGVLNGTVSGANQSSVVATFNHPAHSVFQTGLYSNTLSLADGPLRIAPSSTGATTAQIYLASSAITTPVPEPGTIALFAVTLAGLGLRQRGVLRRRNAATA